MYCSHTKLSKAINYKSSNKNLMEFFALFFSIQLRSVSALFHLWVGGHMISPFSAYDPLFLSHWAFMDRLWAEWQTKNPGGMFFAETI